MTLRTRDLEEVVGASVSFHLNAGADLVIATDHRSTDGTRDVLRAFEREGVLRLIAEDGPDVRGREWRTRMAHLAVSEYGADWVFSADGDEFWWPRGGTYAEVLAAVPPEFGVVRCPWRPFLPNRDETGHFYERMTVRLAAQAPVNEPVSPYRPNSKVAHRGNEQVVVERGNHALEAGGLAELVGWHPIEILHFPIRGQEQYRQKSTAWLGALANQQTSQARSPHRLRVQRLAERGALAELLDAFGVDDEVLARGLEEGSLAVDTRLRDVLRELRLPQPEGAREFAVPADRAGPVRLPAPTLADDAGYAVELDGLSAATAVRARRLVASLERRTSGLERRRSQAGQAAVGSETMPAAVVLTGYGDAEVVAAQLAFHLAAGAGLVLAPADLAAGLERVVEPHVTAGRVRLVDVGAAADRETLRRLGAAARVDWVLPAAPGSFWWPRGGDIAEVLAAVPGRYGVVGSVLRPFAPDERLADPPVTRSRRPFAGPAAIRVAGDPLVPLGGWLPFEVFSVGGPPERVASTPEGNVRDTRLADALRVLGDPGAPSPVFGRAGIVDDAAYARDVAELEAVDVHALVESIGALDQRVAVLERRAWPRVAARLARWKRA